MILNDLDLGGRPAHPAPQGGQSVQTLSIFGGATQAFTAGGTLQKLDIDFWMEAWQALGGAPAGSLAALRYLVQQLEELRSNPGLQPVYLRLAATAQTGAMYPSRDDPRDGWYFIDALLMDLESHNSRGAIEGKMTLTQVAPASPSSLGLRWTGGALTSTYSGTPVPLLAYPLGSTNQVPAAASRTGAEGTIPLSILASGSTLNPALFVRPGTVAGLYQGGVRVLDTINTGSNPVPTSGGFLHANWVQVYGQQHDFAGDCVLTNGLLLILFQVGHSAGVYVWNRNLGTPAWQLQGTVEWQENASNTGPIREVNIDRVGLQEARVRIAVGTTAGNYAVTRWKLQSGQYAAGVELWPLTAANTNPQGLMWRLNAVAKLAYDESAVVDLVTSAGATATPSATLGFGAMLGTAANQPLVGFLYQNPPSNSQPGTFSSTVQGYGDTNGPAQNSYRLYGVFAVPFSATPANLQAEAESGALGTGWSSVVDANASNGHSAQAASGTGSGNADLFGTAWQPPAGTYDVWFRVLVASSAGSTPEMTLGLWDTTAGAFVTGGSVTLRANQAGATYSWSHVNPTTPLQVPAGHNVQFRAVTAATLGTTWTIDEAVLVPIRSTTLGQGDFPGDIWAQWMFERVTALVRG